MLYMKHEQQLVHIYWIMSQFCRSFSFGSSICVERQRGNTGKMIFSIQRLLVELSKVWLLCPGDLVYTGTPSGVGPLKIGDSIMIYSDPIGGFSWIIVE